MTTAPQTRHRWVDVAAPLALFGLALAVRLKGMPLEPNVDELHHVFAARRYLEDGTFSIADGEPYDRAWLFTVSVAWAIRLFGDSLLVARLPAVMVGALAPVLIYLLGRAARQRTAGLIAAVLFALDPAAVLAAQWARFYPFQLLVFLLLTGALYTVARPGPMSRGVRWGLLGASAALALLALHFQIASVIGLAGLVYAVIVVKAPEIIGVWRRRPLVVFLTVGAGLVVALGVGLATGSVVSAWRLAWLNPPWNPGMGMSFYFASLLGRYPLLWSLLPLFLLLGARRDRTFMALTAIPFAVVIAVHTVLPWRADRFANYVLPHFLLAVSLGVVEGLRLLHHGVRRFAVERGVAQQRATQAAIAALVAVAGFASITNRGFVDTARSVTRSREARSYQFPGMAPGQAPMSWARAAPALREVADDGSVVVSPSDLKALYFLGRVDYVLNRRRPARPGAPQEEFGVDPKNGKPLIGTRESVMRLVKCHPSGLIVAETDAWRDPGLVTADVADYVESGAEFRPIALPLQIGLVAFAWRSDGGGHCPP